MSRHGSWSKILVCGALATLLLTPAFATEESAKEKEPAKKAAPADTKAETAPKAEATTDAAECKPTATRVNTLEDVFGIANWLRLQRRTLQPASTVTEVAWRDATADAQPATGKPQTR